MAISYHFPDNIHVTSTLTIKLNNTNYLLWKTQFESLLSCQKLIGFVNCAVTAPPRTTSTTNNEEVPNPQYEAWFCTDQLIRSWLFGTLSEEVLGYVHNITTSRDVWIFLAENFNKSSIARKFTICRSLWVLEKKDMSFAAYCREFIAICDALSSIGKPIDESLKISGFLNGLGCDYDPITTVIQSSLSKLYPPSFGDVVSKVESFDTKLRSYSVPDSIGGRTGHIVTDCWNRFDHNYQRPDVAQVFSSLQISDGNDWVTDFGATAHVTSSATNLQSATTYNGNDIVQVGDVTFLPITHVGSTTIASTASKLSLNEVLVCPIMQKSLIFVSKLCDDLPCGVWFDSNKVCVVDITNQKVVGKGPRSSGLYVLGNQEFVALFSNRQCIASDDTWHHRLGHSNSQILQQLKNSKEIVLNKSINTSICEPCQMGKNSRLQFFSSDS
ncbi:PREDICTED: uncharacterized protein LOC104704503 [Camelina sativa]|uniref:Uncharacterized protein LOC104704503 n=1 Tax=Camelina sativa TaxID=90675 RepID=A0ABM0T0F5_CAMSA|nr:PREDICTED: uncharacterized protein LOC104704503 [Camelina sativa]